MSWRELERIGVRLSVVCGIENLTCVLMLYVPHNRGPQYCAASMNQEHHHLSPLITVHHNHNPITINTPHLLQMQVLHQIILPYSCAMLCYDRIPTPNHHLILQHPTHPAKHPFSQSHPPDQTTPIAQSRCLRP